MKKLAVSLLLILCATRTIELGAQTRSKLSDVDAGQSLGTHGMVNGRLWRSLSLGASRSGFLLGYREGVHGAAEALVSHCEAAGLADTIPTLLPTGNAGKSIDDLADALDQFYTDPANRIIPVAHALMWITGRQSGMTQAVLDQILAEFRPDATKP